jgi:hypothetical protein
MTSMKFEVKVKGNKTVTPDNFDVTKLQIHGRASFGKHEYCKFTYNGDPLNIHIIPDDNDELLSRYGLSKMDPEKMESNASEGKKADVYSFGIYLNSENGPTDLQMKIKNMLDKIYSAVVKNFSENQLKYLKEIVSETNNVEVIAATTSKPYTYPKKDHEGKQIVDKSSPNITWYIKVKPYSSKHGDEIMEKVKKMMEDKLDSAVDEKVEAELFKYFKAEFKDATQAVVVQTNTKSATKRELTFKTVCPLNSSFEPTLKFGMKIKYVIIEILGMFMGKKASFLTNLKYLLFEPHGADDYMKPEFFAPIEREEAVDREDEIEDNLDE